MVPAKTGHDKPFTSLAQLTGGRSTAAGANCVDDDASPTSRPFQLAVRLVRSAVAAADRTAAADRCAASVEDARPVTRETDRRLTGGVHQAALTDRTAQLTACQPRYSSHKRSGDGYKLTNTTLLPFDRRSTFYQSRLTSQ